MTETIVDNTDEEAVAMLLRRCGMPSLPADAQIMGFRDKYGIRGVFCFERYTGEGGSIHAHWAGRDARWLKKYMLNLAFMYAFDQLKCQRLYGEVRAKDLAVRGIDEELGFREIARLPGYYPGDDLVIYEMLKNDCAWLPDVFKEAS